MMGTFVPFHNPPKRRTSANVGWVVEEGGCHVWQGAQNGKGYGRVWVDGRLRPVHRVRYEREVGPIPDGMELDHFVCDNPPCCNPEHVRPASPRENVLRGNTVSAAHAAQTHCVRGHPLSGDNLGAQQGRYTNVRRCRTCTRLRKHKYQSRKQNTPVQESA